MPSMVSHASSGPLVPDDLVEVGRVTAAHGVRGELKVQAYSPQADALFNAPTWWLKAPDSSLDPGALSRAHENPRALTIRSCRHQGGQFLVVQAEGLADRDAAEALRGQTVWVPRTAFPAAEADEYYWVDLIGCDFYGLSQAGALTLLGRVDQVLDNGAHALLQVVRGQLDTAGQWQAQADAKGRPLQVLVPFVAAHVQHVDIAGRRIESDWPADF
ncbi:ribosome maturation factor RimM [Castellaniella caeni]|uniref:ribosome maturation factor RimM n=1 Tax=Castellaniella caeni TaxID=266123 RepID=UPI003F77395F